MTKENFTDNPGAAAAKSGHCPLCGAAVFGGEEE